MCNVTFMRIWVAIFNLSLVALGGVVLSYTNFSTAIATYGVTTGIGAFYLVAGIIGFLSAVYSEKCASKIVLFFLGFILLVVMITQFAVGGASIYGGQLVNILDSDKPITDKNMQSISDSINKTLSTAWTDCCDHTYTDVDVNTCNSLTSLFTDNKKTFDCTSFVNWKSSFFTIIEPILFTLGEILIAAGVFSFLTTIFACCLSCKAKQSERPLLVVNGNPYHTMNGEVPIISGQPVNYN